MTYEAFPNGDGQKQVAAPGNHPWRKKWSKPKRALKPPDRISLKQRELVEHMRRHPYPLMRLPGGRWTTTDCQPLTGESLQKWWGTGTVAALQEMRVIVNETSQPFYRGRFKLAVADSTENKI
jgi:hypothetical protein